MKNRILVTGGNGQLGQSIKVLESKFPNLSITYTDIDDLDITDPLALETYFQNNNFDAIVNCAAYTAVDNAEDNVDLTYLLNSTAVEFLIDISNKHDLFFIQISTDFVFDGKKEEPYTEDDLPNPQSVYAKSKYEAEKLILNKCKSAFILRTSWLYSEYGNNFVKTIIRIANERDEISVVNDQIGTPTYAGDLANEILHILSNNIKSGESSLFNYSNEGKASWHEFAQTIVNITKLNCKVKPISTSEYLAAKAIRPANSLMNKDKYKSYSNRSIPHWKDSLAICLENLMDKQ